MAVRRLLVFGNMAVRRKLAFQAFLSLKIYPLAVFGTFFQELFHF